MKMFAKLLASASFALTAIAAHAAPVSGSINIGGTDTFTSSSVTFNPGTGSVLSSTGSLAVYAPVGMNNINLGSFNFSTTAGTGNTYGGAAGVNLFSNSPNLAFTISTINYANYSTTPVGNSLTVTGTGVFTETGYNTTTGTFSLTTSTTGSTSFQINSGIAATPEPNSLVLLGTGLVGAAGMVFFRRRQGFSL